MNTATSTYDEAMASDLAVSVLLTASVATRDSWLLLAGDGFCPWCASPTIETDGAETRGVHLIECTANDCGFRIAQPTTLPPNPEQLMIAVDALADVRNAAREVAVVDPRTGEEEKAFASGAIWSAAGVELVRICYRLRPEGRRFRYLLVFPDGRSLLRLDYGDSATGRWIPTPRKYQALYGALTEPRRRHERRAA